MVTNPVFALTPRELAACYAANADYCRDNPDAPDWKQHFDRAGEFARLLPDAPLEIQIEQYEAEPA